MLPAKRLPVASLVLCDDANRRGSRLPTRRLANAVRAPVWRWLYTHTDEHDPRLAQFKASHLLEDQFIWHADVQHLGHALTPHETRLSKRMTAYWTNLQNTTIRTTLGCRTGRATTQVQSPP